MHRLLDVLPVFAGDDRVTRVFTLVPGSDFGIDALAAIERVGARTVPWEEACRRSYDLIVAASPKGELRLLRGRRVLLPHGAGFNKTVRGEGSDDSASGLDPAFLVRDGEVLAALYALAHPSQVDRLAAVSPRAAEHAVVVGDPTLERILASRSRREAYRAALGTGARKLIVMTSTWGPESLLRRRPELPAELAARLPYDSYQLALVAHPNERNRTSPFDLVEQLAPALDAGMVLAGAYEEWGAVLIAADAVITDHGSTALYAAALDRPLIGACDGGAELIPGSPMGEVLAHCPGLDDPGGVEGAIAAHRPGAVRALAKAAFAEQGRALDRLREELYALLGLEPPDGPATVRLLPDPRPPVRAPAAFAVRTRVGDHTVRVERFPAHTGASGQHLAVEYDAADERHAQSAGLLYRRAGQAPVRPYSATWTADGWIAHVLDQYPGCRTAGVVMSPSWCLVRDRRGPLLSLRVGPCREDGLLLRTDPAAVLSGVHAWPAAHRDLPAEVTCVIGDRSYPVRVEPATAGEATAAL
ncbi:translation initiation factor 2 [Streptantibioticus cattleyicolor]|uniref:translation initiation factor 2 n=1 Tax=Streptantibioticus cattleyicolor TaxID=29303 RepID=UPI000213DCA6|nr:protein of unknown function [Streptantibioticus cattleyicolor NRRL 8057 = DSM 46488]